MHWRRTDPVQTVGALLAVGQATADLMVKDLSRKSQLIQALPFEQGLGWAVVFAAPLGPNRDLVLPRLEAAIPLYDASNGWWLPVGIELDAPDHARAALWLAMPDFGARPPAIVVPRMRDASERTNEADVYLVRGPTPFADAERRISERQDATQ